MGAAGGTGKEDETGDDGGKTVSVGRDVKEIPPPHRLYAWPLSKQSTPSSNIEIDDKSPPSRRAAHNHPSSELFDFLVTPNFPTQPSCT